MLYALGRLTYRARWAVVLVWVALFAVASLFAPRVSGVLRGGGYTAGNSEAERAYDVLHRAYGFQALTFSAVFTAPPGLEGETVARARAFRSSTLARFGRTLRVSSPRVLPVSRSSTELAVVERIYSQPQEDFGAHFAPTLRAMLPRGAIHGSLAGPSAIFYDMEQVSDEDLQRVELVTLPIAALVLLLIFGSVVSSATPVLMAPVSVTIALAIVYFIGHRISMSIFVLNTASMLGLGVAVDYSLFMVNRFRDELAAGHEIERAVATTVSTSGRAILVSAIVVTAGFYALSLSGVQMLTSLGIGGSIVTAVSLLVALTFLPAVLGILGHRINLLPVLPRGLSVRRAWRSLALWVMRRPVGVIVAVALVIVGLTIPTFHLRVGIPGAQILPPSVDSRAGNDVLARHLGPANNPPVLVVVQRLRGTSASTARAAAFSVLDGVCSSPVVEGIAAVPVPDSPRQIRSCNQVLAVLQSPSASQVARARVLAGRQSTSLLSVFLRTDPSSIQAEGYVRSLRSHVHVPGYRVLVGGQTAGQMDFDNYLYSRFPLVILFVVCTIFLVLLAAFRSLLLPLKAVLMNVFSILAAYGVVVWGFQDGHLAGPLGFTVVGNIDSIVPVFLFCVLFGLSTDYEVFLLTRVQEEYLETGDNEESVATGLEVTGRIITSAALVMMVVFGAFAFARLVIVKEVGLGLAVAVFLDATLIRALLVPATMRLLGRWNWWLPFRGFPTTQAPKVFTPVGKTPAAE